MRKSQELSGCRGWGKHLRPFGKRYYNGIVRRYWKNLEVEEESTECEPQCDCFNCVSQDLAWEDYLENSMVCGEVPDLCDCWDIDI
jgi:hypothetical protein